MFDLRKVLLACCMCAIAGVAAVAQGQQTLNVAAAADLQPVLPSILTEFSAQTGIHGQASFQSSSTLATQIISGGPFDLFMAADLSFPQKVIAAGMAEEAQPIVYAQGTLVLWTRNDSRFKTLSINSLRDPSLKTVAIANAEHAPYGRAAQAALAHLALLDAVKAKLVTAENISQAAQFVQSGNAELGFLSLTSAMTRQMKAEGHFVVVPADAYPPILQGMIVVKRAGAEAAAAHKLVDFLRSPAVVRELEAGGLKPAPTAQAK